MQAVLLQFGSSCVHTLPHSADDASSSQAAVCPSTDTCLRGWRVQLRCGVRGSSTMLSRKQRRWIRCMLCMSKGKESGKWFTGWSGKWFTGWSAHRQPKSPPASSGIGAAPAELLMPTTRQ